MAINVADKVKEFDKLKAERYNFNDLWQSVAHYCIPRKANITTIRMPGEELYTDIYDSTGRISSQVMAAGLASYLTNPSSKWFSLRVQDEDLMKAEGIGVWLKECEERIYDALNSSNFNHQIYECYRELGIFGTATLYEEEDEKDLVRFYSRPVREIYILENKRGEVEEVFRYFEFTAKQAYELFGEQCGEKVQKLLKDNPNEKLLFLHWVGRRDVRTVGKKDSENMPYASVWIEHSTKHLCKEGGYEDFPFFVVRFEKNSGEKYGYSPAINVLPNIRGVNRMKKDILEASEKMIKPPLDVPDDGYVLPIDTSPDAINYHDSTLDKDQRIKALLPDNSYNGLPITSEMIREEQETIKKAFFVDLFLMLTEQKGMTATEVMQRMNEKMLILSPVLGRLMSELLDKIITRTFNILLRAGKLPIVPSALEDSDYVIEYISPLAKAQKAYESQSLQQYAEALGMMQPLFPDIVDIINADEWGRTLADIKGISPQIIRSEEEIVEIRAARAEAQRVQQETEEAMQAVDAYQKVASVEPKEQPSEV